MRTGFSCVHCRRLRPRNLQDCLHYRVDCALRIAICEPAGPRSGGACEGRFSEHVDQHFHEVIAGSLRANDYSCSQISDTSCRDFLFERSRDEEQRNTRRQCLRHVELPLAMPTVLAGVKTAAVINVGTATVAAFIGAGGFGERIVAGLAVNDTASMLAGALPAAVLALLVQLVFGAIERVLFRTA